MSRNRERGEGLGTGPNLEVARMYRNIALIILVLLAAATVSAVPDPGHPAGEISGGTFDDDGTDFTFPRNVIANTRIGIANPAPAYPLDVTGTARATDIIATNIYYAGATAGVNRGPCTANQYLGGIRVIGGIVTAGTCTADGGAGGGITGGGNINYIPVFTGPTEIGNSIIAMQPASNKVGINEVSPATTLHVKVWNAGEGAALGLEGTDHVYINWYPDGWMAGRKAYTGFENAASNSYTIKNEINGGDIILQTTNGKVGIDTGTPQQKFEVNSGTAGTSGVRFTQLTSATTPIANPDPEKGILSVNPTGDVILVTDQSGVGPGTINRIIKFITTTTVGDSVIYENTNRIGIGASPTTYRLEVSGDASATNVRSANFYYLGALQGITTPVCGANQYLGGIRVSGGIITAAGICTDDATGGAGYWAANGNNIYNTNTAGNVGIGTSDPSQKLHVNGAIRADNGYYYGTTPGQPYSCAAGEVLKGITTLGGIVTGGTCGPSGGGVNPGTANRITKYDATGTNIRDSSIYETTTGFIGIGTSSDTNARLRISSGSSGAILFDNGAILRAKNLGGANEDFLWPRWTDNIMYLNYGSAGFNIRNSASANTMWMGQDNKVGIGTTSPTTPLDVRGPTGNIISIRDNTGGGTVSLASGPNSGETHIIMGSSGSIDGAGLALQLNTASNNGLLLRTNGGTRVTVARTGEVGIAGAPIAGRELDVTGEIYGDTIYGETQVYSGGTADTKKVCTADGTNCPGTPNYPVNIQVLREPGGSGSNSVLAQCPGTKKLLSGGCVSSGGIQASYPESTTTWRCIATPGDTITASYALCGYIA